jgi:hypothetical protein
MQPLSPMAAAIRDRDLHPGYFAFVMATGIISTGLSFWGRHGFRGSCWS